MPAASSNHDGVLDPELDDLLDGVLENLSTPSLAPVRFAQPTAAATTTSHPSTSVNYGPVKPISVGLPGIDDDALDLEFAKEMAAGMEELMGSADYNSDKFKTAISAILDSLGSLEMDDEDTTENMVNNPVPSTTDTKDKTKKKNQKKTTVNVAPTEQQPTPETFQDKIKETIARMQNSSEQLEEPDLDSGESDNVLVSEMMKQMEQLTDSQEFEGMLENMMESLMSREILYGPLKDLSEKYPDYLARNKASLSDEEYNKYAQQYDYVTRILQVYDVSGPGSEETEEESRQVIELMTKMQELGQPPVEIMKDIAPDMEMDSKTGIPRFPGLSGSETGDIPAECNVM